MLGRAAYQNPTILSECHRQLWQADFAPAPVEILNTYQSYAAAEIRRDVRLSAITRHAVHCCSNVRGARRFRQVLSNAHRLKSNDPAIFTEALGEVYPEFKKPSVMSTAQSA